MLVKIDSGSLNNLLLLLLFFPFLVFQQSQNWHSSLFTTVLLSVSKGIRYTREIDPPKTTSKSRLRSYQIDPQGGWPFQRKKLPPGVVNI